MNKRMKKVIKLLAITSLLFAVVAPIVISNPQTVEAKGAHSSGGHSSGGHSSGGHSSGHSSGGHSSGHSSGGHSSKSPASRGSKSPASRGGRSNGGSHSPSTRGGSSNGGSRSKSNPATRGKSSNNSGSKSKSNPATRGKSGSESGNSGKAGSNPATRGKSDSNKSGSNKAGSNPAARSKEQKATDKSVDKAYNGFRSRSSYYKSPSDYLYNPYRNNNSAFFNYYLYSSLWNRDNRDNINNSGLEQDKLLNPTETTYWVTVKPTDGTKEEVKVLVTKKQYDQINKNDKLEVKNGKLFINDKEIAP